MYKKILFVVINYIVYRQKDMYHMVNSKLHFVKSSGFI